MNALLEYEKVDGDQWTKQEEHCYSPERVCRLAAATMVLHNICIDHGLQGEVDFVTQEDEIIATTDETTHSGNTVRLSVVADYFD